MTQQEFDKIRQEAIRTGKRFIVLPGSDSGHCCFEATVIDTLQPEIIYDCRGFKNICECFDVSNAEKIAEALNINGEKTCVMQN